MNKTKIFLSPKHIKKLGEIFGKKSDIIRFAINGITSSKLSVEIRNEGIEAGH